MPTKNSRQSTDARQSEIVATLVRLSAERSVSEITTTDIARAMNVSQGALFRHFPTKEAIRLAVVDWIDATLMQRLLEVRQHASSPVGALRGMFMAHVAFAIEYPGAPRLVFGELQQPNESPIKHRVCRLMQHYRELLSEIPATAASANPVRSDVDRPAAALFLGAIQGLVIQSMVSGTTQHLMEQAQAVFGLYQQGLEAKP